MTLFMAHLLFPLTSLFFPKKASLQKARARLDEVIAQGENILQVGPHEAPLPFVFSFRPQDTDIAYNFPLPPHKRAQESLSTLTAQHDNLKAALIAFLDALMRAHPGLLALGPLSLHVIYPPKHAPVLRIQLDTDEDSVFLHPHQGLDALTALAKDLRAIPPHTLTRRITSTQEAALTFHVKARIFLFLHKNKPAPDTP